MNILRQNSTSVLPILEEIRFIYRDLSQKTIVTKVYLFASEPLVQCLVLGKTMNRTVRTRSLKQILGFNSKIQNVK